MKLAYFFERFFQRVVADVIPGDINMAAFKKEELAHFEEIFPRYAWGNKAFAISYRHGELEVSITRSGGRKNNPATLQLTSNLTSEVKRLSKEFDQKVSKYKETERFVSSMMLVRMTQEIMKDSPISSLNFDPIFIPASRSFFANIEKNVFLLLSAKFDIDPLLAEFGATLERTKELLLRERAIHSDSPKGTHEVRRKDWISIIHGEYVFDGKDEVIETKGRRTRLAHSSSGQQEVIPLLLVLTSTRRRRTTLGASTYFIEEPEAHLFPEAQKAIAHLLARAANRSMSNNPGGRMKGRVLITTHSPYILTAINNLAAAGRIAGSLTEEEYSELTDIIPAQSIIPPSDLCAYRVNEGTVDAIIDGRTGLINAYLVDQVSEHFSDEFDKLIGLSRRSNKSERVNRG